MKKIVIWGTGEAGKKAYKNIAKYSHRYYVSYWGDSDLSKVGNTMYGIPIIGVDSLKQKNISLEHIERNLMSGAALRDIGQRDVPLSEDRPAVN